MIYWFYRLLACLIRALPLKTAYWLLLRICDAFYFLNRRGARAVRENLRVIFEFQEILPSRRILDGCARKTFQYFGKYLADFIRYRKLSAEEIRERVSIQGLEHIEAIRTSPRGAILLTAHFGNWELGGSFLTSLGLTINAVVRPVTSPSLERIFQFFREQRGFKLLPLAGAGFGIIRALRRGEVVALVGDRDFTGSGRPARFFGRVAPLPHGAAWFACHTGVPLYLGFVVRAPDDTFILRIHPPIDPAIEPNEEAIQNKIIAILEDTIARDPCQWFIFEPFWPAEAPPPAPDPGQPAGAAQRESPAAKGPAAGK